MQDHLECRQHPKHLWNRSFIPVSCNPWSRYSYCWVRGGKKSVAQAREWAERRSSRTCNLQAACSQKTIRHVISMRWKNILLLWMYAEFSSALPIVHKCIQRRSMAFHDHFFCPTWNNSVLVVMFFHCISVDCPCPRDLLQPARQNIIHISWFF